jgi:predicted Zn-ribbon and HTH transcriptional regulator
VAQIVKQKPECRHCGAVLDHALSRCPRCGKRSWLNLFFRGWGQRY